MLKFGVELIGEDELRATFLSLSDKLRAAVGEKLMVLTEALRLKVVGNVSGLLLQKQTGALAESIIKEVDVDSEIMEGFVVPRPANVKAFAQEFGAKVTEDIYPTSKSALRFIGKDGEIVFAKFVRGHITEPKYYLRTALAEMEPEVLSGFQEVVDKIVGLA